MWLSQVMTPEEVLVRQLLGILALVSSIVNAHPDGYSVVSRRTLTTSP